MPSDTELLERLYDSFNARDIGAPTIKLLAPEVGLAAPVSAALRLEPKGSNPKQLALSRLANDKTVGS
jgi:hypothetical protein